jgi:hypothetical protein
MDVLQHEGQFCHNKVRKALEWRVHHSHKVGGRVKVIDVGYEYEVIFVYKWCDCTECYLVSTLSPVS